jgi:hypothetical protein
MNYRKISPIYNSITSRMLSYYIAPLWQDYISTAPQNRHQIPGRLPPPS